MEVYELFVRLMPAWLIMMLAILAGGGWIWRWLWHVKYSPPLVSKIFAGVGWFMVAIFYAIQEFAPPLPLIVDIFMIRATWMLLATNAIALHAYVFYVRRSVASGNR